MLNVAFGESVTIRTRVYEGYKRFISDSKDVGHDERPECPRTSTTNNEVEKVKEMIMDNRPFLSERLVSMLVYPLVQAMHFFQMFRVWNVQHQNNLLQNCYISNKNNNPYLLEHVITSGWPCISKMKSKRLNRSNGGIWISKTEKILTKPIECVQRHSASWVLATSPNDQQGVLFMRVASFVTIDPKKTLFSRLLGLSLHIHRTWSRVTFLFAKLNRTENRCFANKCVISYENYFKDDNIDVRIYFCYENKNDTSFFEHTSYELVNGTYANMIWIPFYVKRIFIKNCIIFYSDLYYLQFQIDFKNFLLGVCLI